MARLAALLLFATLAACQREADTAEPSLSVSAPPPAAAAPLTADEQRIAAEVETVADYRMESG